MGLEIQVLLYSVSLWHSIDVNYQLHTSVGEALTKQTQQNYYTEEAV